MGDYAVKITVRNGRLLKRIRDAGYTSLTAFANAHGMSIQQLSPLVTMRIAAFTPKGEWRQIAWDLSSALHCEPEDLFNEQQRVRALERNSGEMYMDGNQIAQIMDNNFEQSVWAKLEVEKLINVLPNERERKVVQSRFLENRTLEDLGTEQGVTKERIRDIEIRALRRIKDHFANKASDFALRVVLDEDGKFYAS